MIVVYHSTSLIGACENTPNFLQMSAIFIAHSIQPHASAWGSETFSNCNWSINGSYQRFLHTIHKGGDTSP